MMRGSIDGELYCHKEPKSAPWWAYLLILGLLLAISGCASRSALQTSGTSDSPIVVQRANNELSEPDLFSEAHRCHGTVRYQAEMQRGEIRSRLSCEWQVEEDDWGAW